MSRMDKAARQTGAFAQICPAKANRAKTRDQFPLNNNRNNNNRRRGRGNRNQSGGSGGGNAANRIDSRARGNAPQLLDKYKKLAQDAQHHGDRVQAEYYLQFADHYFRVIADNKARQEEARAKRSEERGSNDDGDDADNEGEDNRRGRGRGRGRRDERDEQSDRSDRNDRNDRGERGGRSRRSNSADQDAAIDGDDALGDKGESETPKPKKRAPRRRKEPEASVTGELDASILPPAISAVDHGDGGSEEMSFDDGEQAEAEEKPAPRRRRKRKDDGDTLSVKSEA